MISFRATMRLAYIFKPVLMSALLVGAVAIGARAQQPDEVITTDTALVQLNVGVVDKQGRAITNLSQNDFTVFENGVRRPIVHFEPTDAPFSLVLLLDMSGSTVNFRQQIQMAALRFLDALSPEDRVAVVGGSHWWESPRNSPARRSFAVVRTGRSRLAQALHGRL